jgi:CheY-like chemotaxis protein
MAPKILVVEDDRESLSAYVRLLQIQGHYVVRGVDGYQSAAEAMEHEEFDLLVSDIGLWDGDGCDLFQDLRRKHHIKGIAVSGYDQPEDVQRCLDAGFACHIVKPVSLSSLLDTITQTLHKS